MKYNLVKIKKIYNKTFIYLSKKKKKKNTHLIQSNIAYEFF